MVWCCYTRLQRDTDDGEKYGWRFKTFDFVLSFGRVHVYTPGNLISKSLAMLKSHNATKFGRLVKMPARGGARKDLWISADSSSSPQALSSGGVELRGKVSSARHQDGFVKLHRLHRLHRTALRQGRGWLALHSTWRMATHPPWWSRLPSWHQTNDNRQIITEDIRMRHGNVAKIVKGISA